MRCENPRSTPGGGSPPNATADIHHRRGTIPSPRHAHRACFVDRSQSFLAPPRSIATVDRSHFFYSVSVDAPGELRNEPVSIRPGNCQQLGPPRAKWRSGRAAEHIAVRSRFSLLLVGTRPGSRIEAIPRTIAIMSQSPPFLRYEPNLHSPRHDRPNEPILRTIDPSSS
jgi:hypothetical protein